MPQCLNISASMSCGDGDNRPARILANTGQPMRLAGWSLPVVIDLSGVSDAPGGVVIAVDHRVGDVMGVIGRVTGRESGNDGLWLVGEILADTDEARHVVGMSRAGHKWQASVGLSVLATERVAAGSMSSVNDREYSGPIEIARASVLREVSIVVHGADQNTSAIIGRECELNENELAAQAAAEQARVNSARESAAAEVERIAAVRTLASSQPEIAARAIREGWTAERTVFVSTAQQSRRLESGRLLRLQRIGG